MNILSIDSSNGIMLGLSVNGEKHFFIDQTNKKQSDNLLEEIDKLLDSANLKIRDIDVIAVNVGPGSFTGIRVAISTAKGLAIGAKTKVITFSSFECYDNLPENNYGVILSGFGENYYYHYKKFGRVFEGCNTLEKIKVFAEGTQTFVSDELLEKTQNCKSKVLNYDPFNVINKKIEKNEYVLTNQIAPIYLRLSQAEIERAKHGN